MAIRNASDIDRGFANLAQMFAPPSGGELAGYARARLANTQADQLGWLFDNPNDPTASNRAALVGVQGYGNTPAGFTFGVDQNNATSRANNAADNARVLQQTNLQQAGETTRTMLAPVAAGATRFVPPTIADMYSVPQEQVGVISANPGERVFTPSGATFEGGAKPLTETEWNAAQKARLHEQGALTDDMLIDHIMGDRAPVQASGPDGPIFMSPGAAVRQGASPYVAPSAANLDGDNYLGVTEDGQEARFVGRLDQAGQIVDVNTGQPFRGRIVRREGTGGGMSLEVGKDGTVRMITGNGAGQTTARVTDLQRQEAETGRGVQELTALFNSLRPDDLGVAGNINEVLTNYGAQIVPGVARPDVAATRAQLEATTLGLARVLVGDDRLSDNDRRAANEVMVSGGLGESLPGAQAKLSALITLSAYRQRYAEAVRTGGQLPELDGAMLGRLVDEGVVSPQVAQVYSQTVLARRPQAQNSPIPGVAIPHIPADDVPTVATPEEAAALPPGTRFRTPDGREKVRP